MCCILKEIGFIIRINYVNCNCNLYILSRKMKTVTSVPEFIMNSVLCIILWTCLWQFKNSGQVWSTRKMNIHWNLKLWHLNEKSAIVPFLWGKRVIAEFDDTTFISPTHKEFDKCLLLIFFLSFRKFWIEINLSWRFQKEVNVLQYILFLCYFLLV